MSVLIAVVLAIAGAPQGTTVTCSGVNLLYLDGQPQWGETTIAAVPGAPAQIVLSRTECRLLEGRGTLADKTKAAFILLHEADHAALDTLNECEVNARTVALAPQLVTAIDPPLARGAFLQTAQDTENIEAPSLLGGGCPVLQVPGGASDGSG